MGFRPTWARRSIRYVATGCSHHAGAPIRHLSFAQRFSLPPGVKVSIPHYGQTASAPVYNTLYMDLESAGYRLDRDLVVAGYDFRLTPDLGGFMPAPNG